MAMPTEELQMLRDTASRVASDATAAGLPEERDASAPVWSSAMELGWLMLPFAEDDGGLGGGAAEVCALTEELGRSLLVGSYVIGTILPARLASAAPAGELRTELIGELIGGTRTVACADTEPKWRGVSTQLTARARESGGGWSLEAVKSNIWCCAQTRRLLVSAAIAGDEQRELVAVVPLDVAGLTVREYQTIDGGRALECALANVKVKATQILIPPGRGVRELRESAWDLALVAAGAECVGMMKALLQRTAEYLRSRKQFGQPLATFQALRHRMADMALACRRAEALGARVAEEFAGLEPRERSRLASAVGVKAFAGARYICEQSIQLHGGMGVSAEVPVGRYLRRLLALQATFGSPEHHRARFSGLAA